MSKYDQSDEAYRANRRARRRAKAGTEQVQPWRGLPTSPGDLVTKNYTDRNAYNNAHHAEYPREPGFYVHPETLVAITLRVRKSERYRERPTPVSTGVTIIMVYDQRVWPDPAVPPWKVQLVGEEAVKRR